MKSKRMTAILVLVLTVALCLGNIPMTYAAEFSSGEELSAENIIMENVDGADMFSDSTVDDYVENADSENVEEILEEEIFTDTESELNLVIDENSEDEITQQEFIFINPLYADEITVDDLVRPEEAEYIGDSVDTYSLRDSDVTLFSSEALTTQAEALPTVDTIEEAGVLLRECMLKRETTLKYVYEITDGKGLERADIFEKMDRAVTHTGIPTEGDYLKYQYAGFDVSLVGNSISYTVTWTITYYTTADQEKVMDQAVASLLSSMKLTGKSDYEKVSAIYDYICTNVKYDYANLNDKTYKLKYSGYAALINKTAVCQGYAVLMYRLLLESGVDCRIVAGTSYSDAHSWNIVKLGNAYYNADATWDAGYLTYKYFLKCEANFTNHTRNEEYTAESFLTAYPIDSADYVAKESDISTGTQYIENDVIYRIVNGTAIVIGYQGTSEKVVIPGIINNASVTAVSSYAFYGNDSLKVIQFTGNAPAIDRLAFYGVSGIVAYPYDNTTWTKNMLQNYSGTLEWIAHGENVHTWIKNETSSIEATCESGGKVVWNCPVCNKEKTEELAVTGHSWSDWTVSKEASYGTDGLKERTCGKCKRKETETIAKKVLAAPVVESVSAISDKKIEITWTPVEGASGYYIYYKTTGNGWSLLAQTDASISSYTDSTPTAGVSYTYTVRAYVIDDGKTYSSEYESGKSATAKTAAPTVTVKELAYNKVQVTWNTVEDAIGYRVYRKAAGGSWTKLKLVSGVTTSYTDSKVVPGTKYYYMVRGYCKPAGTTLWGSFKSSKAITTKTAAPALVSAKSSSYNKIKITWKSVAGATGYRVYRKVAGGSWKTLKTVSASITSYTDATAITGTNYYYTVKSYRKVNGKTVWGRYETAGIKGTAKTAAPTLVSAKILSSGKTTITWKPVAGATGYRIYVKDSNGKWTSVKTLGSSITSYTYSKSYGASKTYTVRAYRKVNGKNVWGYYKSAGIKSK